MENNQLLPFERNRYYVGKLLTSADFQAEQAYFNHKRQFLNKMLCGEGIICGLGVYNLDDTAIMVESGVCVDGLGHEIVIEGSVIKKLSAVEGFESLCSDKAALCLRYSEEPVHPVYSVRSQESGEGYECNRIREGFQLFLQDADTMMPATVPESEFLATGLLYGDNDFAVECSIPTIASCGHSVRLLLTITRHSETEAHFSLDTTIQTPALLSAGGDHELHIKLTDLEIPREAPLHLEYWLTAQDQPVAETVLIAGADVTHIKVGEVDRAVPENFLMKLALETSSPDALVSRAIGTVSLETREMAGIRDFVPIAILTIQHTKSAYLIDHVEQSQVKHYLSLPSSATTRGEYSAWFSPGDAPSAVGLSKQSTATAESGGSSYQDPIYASGVCEIPLGANARRGQIFHSDEILHNLGKGNIYVQVGFEYLAEDTKLGATARNTIYGDPQLFADEEPPISFADTAVKVMNDRGSFMVAAQLNRDTTQILLTLRWVAIRLPVGEEPSKIQRMAGKSISAAQPTVVMATRETHYFSVRFKNMEPCTLTYELTERDSGEISSDGVYTAPTREGVYEIRISCADMPLVSTYAYAVVKKKDSDDDNTTEA